MKEMRDPIDIHIKMTVRAWSNMLTNKINELTKNNGVITKNVILRRRGKLGTFEGCRNFQSKEKEIPPKCKLTKTKYSVLCDQCCDLFLRGVARTGTATSTI